MLAETTARVRWRGKLAIPKLGLRHIDTGFDDAVFIKEHMLKPALLDELLDFGERLVPIEIGVVDQHIGGTAEAETVEKWKVVRIGANHDHDGGQ